MSIRRSRWILLLGGTTRVGNRRARRLVVELTKLGASVMWVDGFVETVPGAQGRVPIDGVPLGHKVEILEVKSEFVAASRHSLSALTEPLLVRLAKTGSRASSLARRFATFTRRLENLGRGRRFWSVVRRNLDEVGLGEPPTAVLYCDDSALLAAWHLARRWPSSAVGSSLEGARRHG